jgi:uncharacterized damage-inducible protein DinB
MVAVVSMRPPFDACQGSLGAVDTAKAFIDDACERLRDVLLPRLRRAVLALPEDDLWWRPHAGSTSVGVLLRHLEGNVRQWIVSGLGSRPDARKRSAEFVDGPSGDGAALLARLQDTVLAAVATIAALDDAALLRTHSIQGCAVSGLCAVAHVVEHFSWHTGQVTWIAKLRAGPAHGVAFYDDDALDAAHNDPT